MFKKNRTPPGGKNFTSIPTSTLAYIAWQNLVHKKLRTFLTVFGVIIGIGAICFLLSFGVGLQELVTKEVIGNQSINSVEISSPNSKIIKLDEKNIEKVRSLPHISQLGSSFSYAGGLLYGASEVDTVVYGVDAQYQKLTNLNTSEGRLIEKEDGKVALVNKTALSTIGITDSKAIINRDITLNIPITNSETGTKEIKDTFRVVGVIDSGKGAEIFIPNFVFENAGITTYSQIKLVADDNKNVSNLRKQIESLGFETSSPSDTIEQINQIFQFFTIMLVGFGAIGMIIAVLGMFNTLTISLLERTKELGLMIALGGRNKDMKLLFIFEAVILSVVGAVAGIILAMIHAGIVNLIMNGFARSRGVTEPFSLFSFPFWLIGGLVLFMVIVGLAVVYFPAKRAEKINPIEALRRE